MLTRLRARYHQQPWIGARWFAGVPAGQGGCRHQQQLLLPRVLPVRQLVVHSVSVGLSRWWLLLRQLLREQDPKISGSTRFSAARRVACHVGTQRPSHLCESWRHRELRAIDVVGPTSETRMLSGNSIVVVAGLQEMRHFRLAASMAAALSTLATRFRFVDCTPGLLAAAPVVNIVASMAMAPGGARLSLLIDAEPAATQRTT